MDINPASCLRQERDFTYAKTKPFNLRLSLRYWRGWRVRHRLLCHEVQAHEHCQQGDTGFGVSHHAASHLYADRHRAHAISGLSIDAFAAFVLRRRYMTGMMNNVMIVDVTRLPRIVTAAGCRNSSPAMSPNTENGRTINPVVMALATTDENSSPAPCDTTLSPDLASCCSRYWKCRICMTPFRRARPATVTSPSIDPSENVPPTT